MKAYLQRVVGNSLLLFASRIFSKLATIISVVVLARNLGSGLFGVFSGIIALTSVAGVLADFGLVIPTIRSVAGSDAAGTDMVSRTLSARLVWSCSAFLMAIILGVVFTFPFLLTVLFATSAIQEVFMTGLIRTFEGRQDMKTITKFSITERMIFTIVVLGSLSLFGTLTAVAFAYFISFSINVFLAVYIFQSHFTRLKFIMSWKDITKYTVTGFPFLLIAAASALYYKVDTLILGIYRPPEQVGIYNAALRVVDAQTFIPLSIMATVFPILTKLFRRKDPELFHFLKQSVVLFVVAGCIAGAAIFIGAPIIIRVLYSSAYEAAAPVLRILSLMIVFLFIYYIFAYALMALHREVMFTAAMIAVACVGIVGNYLVIPRFGYLGAAWMRAGTEGLLALSLGIILFLELKKFVVQSAGTVVHHVSDDGGISLLEVPTESV